MKQCLHDDTIQHTGSGGDVDDLIFGGSEERTVSER